MTVSEDFHEHNGYLLGDRYRAIRFELDGMRIKIYYAKDSEEERVIDEAHHRGIPLGGQYSVRMDKPRIAYEKPHGHFFARDRELFAINNDGTTKHGVRGTRIPQGVIDGLRAAFPDFHLPASGHLESFDRPGDLLTADNLLLEDDG